MRPFKNAATGNVFLSKWHPYGWIVLAVCVVYFRAIAFGFTNLDDNALITNNYSFLSNFSNIVRAFGQKVFAHSILPYYRPVLTVSLIIDANLGGIDPFVYHIHNILLHAVSSCLVYPFLMRIGVKKEISLIFSLIFAVHPALAPAVVWIPGRNDSLMAVFTLASFIFLLDFLKKGGRLKYALHMAFLAIALFTKESAVMIIPLAVIYAVIIKKERIFSGSLVKLYAGYLVVAGVWYLARRAATAGSYEMSLYDGTRFALMYLPAVVQFIGKAFFPFNLSVFPTVQGTSPVYGIASIIIISAAMALSRNKRVPLAVFAMAWFVLFLVPSLARPHAGFINDVLEHRLYVPILGLLVLLAEIDIIKNARSFTLILGAALILLFGALSIWRSDDFRDKFSFWEKAVMTSPDSPYAHLLLGVAYLEDGEGGRAEREFRRVTSLDPQMMRVHYYMGLVYMNDGQFREASREFRKEMALHPEFGPAYSSLAVAYYKMGKSDGLDMLWKTAIELNPDNLEAYRNLAIYYYNRGDMANARTCVRQLEDRGVAVPSDFLNALDAFRKN